MTRSGPFQPEEPVAGRRREKHALGRPIVVDGEIHSGPVGGGEIAGLLEDESGRG